MKEKSEMEQRKKGERGTEEGRVEGKKEGRMHVGREEERKAFLV